VEGRKVLLGDLFTGGQAWLLAAGLGLSVVRCFRSGRDDELRAATAVSTLVMVGLFVLFGQQYAWHDYYAIATFYPTATLLIVRLALEVNIHRRELTSWMAQGVAALVVLGLAISLARPMEPLLRRRGTSWYRFQVAWLDHGRELLETCGSRCAGPVAVLGAEAPNLPLTHLDRQGYVLGTDLDEGLGVPNFGSLDHLVEYLDARRVGVLLVRRRVFDDLPIDQVARYFELVLDGGDVVLLIRKGSMGGSRGSDNRLEGSS